ncbi:MAG TPA: class II poly(R)-hydroxyalkanoic acid synthase [Alphaproteobacteria bacterium]|nr:class II poly(R)-hydroxyalkanoic acid synthase [Alphaproteobacteria bacterium]
MDVAKQTAKTAKKAIESIAEQAAQSTIALNPIVGLNRQELLRAVGLVATEIVRQPLLFTKHAGAFGNDVFSVLRGKSEYAPEPRDKRFMDKFWQENAVYKRGMQGWLALRKNLRNWVDDAEMSPTDKTRANFVLDILTDAVAPTNSLIGNPAALKKAYESRGRSLVKGLGNLYHDVMHNGGMPSQVDKRPFKVGKNLAITPGKVVYRTEMLELIQYTPTTPSVSEKPLLIIPPQINKFYASDLTADKSMFRYLVGKGIQLFAISWRNPTKKHAHWGLKNYIEEIIGAVDVTLKITKQKSLNLSGACSGGITMASMLSYLAAHKDKRINAVTFLVCVLDPQKDDSEIGAFVTPKTIEFARVRSRKRGILTGQDLSRTFAWLRPNDLIWNYVINNYLLGEDPPPFDILYWNNDSTNLPAQLHSDYLDLYEKQPMANPGTVEFMNHKLDITKVKNDAFIVGGVTDHITPWRAVYRTTQMIGTPKENIRFVLSSSGHIQSLINPPGNPKARFFMNSGLPASTDEWIAGAGETKGSWWDMWADWLIERSGKTKRSSKKLGSAAFPPLGEAPGDYVHG